jgi:hypothetical protein
MSSSKSMALPVPTHDRAALLGAGGAELELVLLLLLLEPDDDDDEAAAERDERKGDAEMIEAIADGCGAGVLESASRGGRERGRTGRCQRPGQGDSRQSRRESRTDGATSGHGRRSGSWASGGG